MTGNEKEKLVDILSVLHLMPTNIRVDDYSTKTAIETMINSPERLTYANKRSLEKIITKRIRQEVDNMCPNGEVNIDKSLEASKNILALSELYRTFVLQ